MPRLPTVILLALLTWTAAAGALTLTVNAPAVAVQVSSDSSSTVGSLGITVSLWHGEYFECRRALRGEVKRGEI